VKRYSSGMYARLGFSVAAHVNPDVLLVDEVLSVGDSLFQVKCLDRIRYLLKQGTTVVFISHNMEAILELCKRVILLDKGVCYADGAGADVVHEYWKRLHEADGEDLTAPIDVRRVSFEDAKGSETLTVKSGENVRLRLRFRAKTHLSEPIVGVALYDERNTCIFGTNTSI